MTLCIRNLTRRFGAGAPALDGISLELPSDAYVCVMGPSGSGKTTLLRILAGLEPADAGEVLLHDRSLLGVPPERRPIHTVFQDHALFPHLDVLDNVAFAAQVAGQSRTSSRTEAEARLRELGLPASLGARAPATLSGGEAQRVALARALVEHPRLVLLDEPLAALDRPRRAELRRMLHALQRRHQTGFLHVTHDPVDALALADHVVVLEAGRVRAVGSPEALYRRPPDLATARLLGELSPVPDGSDGWLRPERLRVVPSGGVSARVIHASLLGPVWELELRCGELVVLAHVAQPPEGDTCELVWDPDDVLSLPA